MDYGDRAETLGTSDFFRPETGNYMITFLGEGKPTTRTFNEGTPQEKTVSQVEFKIKVEGQEYTWTVTEAKAFNSLYGQVMLLGRFHGSLEGKTIHMGVQGDGKKRAYMIQEATELVKKAEDDRKARLETQKSDPFQTPAEVKESEPPAADQLNPDAKSEPKKEAQSGASSQSSLDELYEGFGK